MENRVNSIDGLRAVAMTMVIAQHCGLLPFVWIGVWIFYVISGYVITRGFISEDLRFPHISKSVRLHSFLRRRAIRIFPAYFAYILLTIITYFIINGYFSDFTYWGLFSFTYNWQMIFGPIFPEKPWPGIGHLWTISVEQQFYLFFPLLFLFVPAKFRWQSIFALVLAGPLIRYGYDVFFVIPHFSENIGHSAFSIYAASFCHFDAFLVGALLAKNEKNLTENIKLKTTFLLITAFALLAYTFTYVFVNINLGAKGVDTLRNIFSGYLYGQNKQIWLYSVIDLFTFSLFLLIFSQSAWVKWLSHRWVNRVGRISFGGYLIHMFVLWMYQLLLHVDPSDYAPPLRILSFCFIWIFTVMMAHLSFEYFEQPISKKLKQWATPYI